MKICSFETQTRRHAPSKFGRANTKTALPSRLGVLTAVRFADLLRTSPTTTGKRGRGGTTQTNLPTPPPVNPTNSIQPSRRKTIRHFLLRRRHQPVRLFPATRLPAIHRPRPAEGPSRDHKDWRKLYVKNSSICENAELAGKIHFVRYMIRKQ